MKTLATALLILVATASGFGQEFNQGYQTLFKNGVVGEAQEQIAKEKHDARLAQAKKLLERQAQLQRELQQVNDDLRNVQACDKKDQGWSGTDCKEEDQPHKFSIMGATGTVSIVPAFTTSGLAVVTR